MRISELSDEQLAKARANMENPPVDFQEVIMRRITDLELQQMQLEGIVSVLLFMLKGKL